MFWPIFLITAGLLAARDLLTKLAQPTEAGAGLDRARLPEATGGRQLPQPPDETRGAEGEVREQLNLALISTGLSAVTAVFSPAVRLLGGFSLLYAAIPLFRKAGQIVFKEHRLGIEVLDSLGVVSTLFLGDYLVSSIMFLLYAWAQRLRLKTEKSSRQSLLEVFAQRPDFVWILKDQVEVQAPFESLHAGDVVVVDAGAPIPADGVVLRGVALVDQHLLTGEAQPAEKEIGNRVFASTMVISGRLYIRVETAGRDTVASEIAGILRNTADFTATIESQGQKIADQTVVPTLALTALAYPFCGSRGSIALLNSGFLDNMRVVAPVSMLNFLRMASEAGILIKDGRSLHLLPKVDTVVFDKTGTLTLEQPRVSNIYTLNGASEGDVLACAAAAEFRQAHPIARAILHEAHVRGQSVPRIDEAQYRAGYGLAVKIGDRWIQVGSRRFMENEGIGVPASFDEIQRNSYDRGCSLVYVARAGALLGVIELEPAIRPEIKQIIERLRERKLSLYILSGDHEKPTRMIAETLGFDHYFAGVLPKDKARLIVQLQQQGRTVCFVGDGINDSIALKKATVSVSMSGASTVATDSAQVVMMDQGLKKLPLLFDMAYGFQDNVKDIMTAVCIPEAVGIGGVFFARFTAYAMTVLYVLSVASGLMVAMYPYLENQRKKIAGTDGGAHLLASPQSGI